jgi:predicted nucleic acid-binding protein
MRSGSAREAIRVWCLTTAVSTLLPVISPLVDIAEQLQDCRSAVAYARTCRWLIRTMSWCGATSLGAGHLARAHALRGADAVHLASALAVGDPGLIVAVWDRRLHTGAPRISS